MKIIIMVFLVSLVDISASYAATEFNFDVKINKKTVSSRKVIVSKLGLILSSKGDPLAVFSAKENKYYIKLNKKVITFKKAHAKYKKNKISNSYVLTKKTMKGNKYQCSLVNIMDKKRKVGEICLASAKALKISKGQALVLNKLSKHLSAFTNVKELIRYKAFDISSVKKGGILRVSTKRNIAKGKVIEMTCPA